ncbi:anthranilate synthase component II [Clostridium thermarum]|uniref:anthranilate synthase component II n=1 Tax=Clostridium thermarum TaxID=1716543 RepID=UPI001121BA56|nr:aminodeoxychorismate/anthranilate synthase component II [Clostridium thermarum]
MILIIDNYDSFTYNLYQYVGQYHKNIFVVRNNQVTVEKILELKPDGIILSPGPGRPEAAGICVDLIKQAAGVIPILGICLGHQAIACAFGGNIVRAADIVHGKVSKITNDGKYLFKGLQPILKVMRYHSLVVEKASLPKELIVTAETEDGTIMAIRHRKHAIFGLQFHPESILTDKGKEMIRNFLEEICYVR